MGFWEFEILLDTDLMLENVFSRGLQQIHLPRKSCIWSLTKWIHSNQTQKLKKKIMYRFPSYITIFF